jgi:hypothetical protein
MMEVSVSQSTSFVEPVRVLDRLPEVSGNACTATQNRLAAVDYEEVFIRVAVTKQKRATLKE